MSPGALIRILNTKRRESPLTCQLTGPAARTLSEGVRLSRVSESMGPVEASTRSRGLFAHGSWGFCGRSRLGWLSGGRCFGSGFVPFRRGFVAFA